MAEEILALSTIVERATINVSSKKHPGGKLYELANLDDLSPYDHAAIVNYASVADELLPKQKRTPAQERQLKKALTDAVGLLFLGKMEPAVIGELAPAQMSMILMAWGAQVKTSGPEAGSTGNPRRPRRTGAKSSPASRSSTGARRKTGSGRRRGS